MGSIIFVHGTGVRQEGYEETFKKIARQTQRKPEMKDLHLTRCVWGEVHGARLLGGGSSIPGYTGKAAVAPEGEIVKWWLLYQDPLFELKLLRENSDREAPPRTQQQWESRKLEIAGHPSSPELEQLLEEHGLDRIWRQAFARLTQTDEWRETLPPRDVPADQFYPEFCGCVAEAVMAEASLQALAAGVPVLTAEIRNQIVEQFLADLDAKVRGPRDWFNALGRTAKWMALQLYAAGDYVFSEIISVSGRSWAMDALLPFPGDILYYQARGQRIRDFIEREIQKAEPPVYLLAHSLGGIACVDLLIEKDLRHRVAGLITAGSQAPLFYEMDCLVSLPRDANTTESPLPAHFPPWLNFHDPNDYLSYKAKEIFNADSRITDELISSRQPHLMAHSAYWSEKKLWARMAAFINETVEQTSVCSPPRGTD